MLFDCGRCIVCGVYNNRSLCKNHKKCYRFIKNYGFYALKPHKEISRPQDALFHNIRDIFKKPTFQEVIFEFNLFRRYDIVVPDLKLEVEFDGPQHFKFNKFFHHTKAEFEDSKAVDILKENIMRGHGYTVIRFSHIEKVNNMDYVRKKLALKGFKNG